MRQPWQNCCSRVLEATLRTRKKLQLWRWLPDELHLGECSVNRFFRRHVTLLGEPPMTAPPNVTAAIHPSNRVSGNGSTFDIGGVTRQRICNGAFTNMRALLINRNMFQEHLSILWSYREEIHMTDSARKLKKKQYSHALFGTRYSSSVLCVYFAFFSSTLTTSL